MENWSSQARAFAFPASWQYAQFDPNFHGQRPSTPLQGQCQLYHGCQVPAVHPMELLYPLHALTLRHPVSLAAPDGSGIQHPLRPCATSAQLQSQEDTFEDGMTSSSDCDLPPDGKRRRRRRRGKRKRTKPRPLKKKPLPPPEETLEERALWGGGVLGPLARVCDGWACVLHDVHRRSFVSYRKQAFPASTLHQWRQTLLSRICWRKPERPPKEGKEQNAPCEALLPRSAAWLTLPGCRCEYQYAGLRFPAATMPPWFLEITDQVAQACGLKERPNSCNANLYKGGMDNVSWHCDDEPLFDATGRDALIISLSLGATRSFCLRPKDDPFEETLLQLEDGDLCTMEGLCPGLIPARPPRLKQQEKDLAFSTGIHKRRLKVIEDYPWEVWALDTAEAFEQLNFKVLVPHPVEDSEDLLWSLVERPYNQTLPDGSRRGPPVATARFWTNMHAPPGRAFAVEGMNRLSPVQEWLPKLYATLGIAGSVDLYCARVGRRPVNSYGWHTDTVDALIYVLNGTKRVRVAGHFPGSRVTLDKVISAGSVVYVPGGRFHSLRSMPADVDASKAELVVALSIGLPNPNEDLLEVRTNVMRKAFENQNFKWNDVIGQVAALPEDFPRKPEVVFAEKDDLDSHGFSALHRRTLQGDARRLAVLLHSGAEVNLRSLPSAQRPALTALGLAACCVAEAMGLWLFQDATPLSTSCPQKRPELSTFVDSANCDSSRELRIPSLALSDGGRTENHPAPRKAS
ncbi:ALKBH3 [Symbiodinium sp. KB8]|nr:ALKBH3 [Symbiodinium sp. KB8]